MKPTPLPKMVRYLRVIFVASAFTTVVSMAHASMTCSWLDEFSRVSDPSIQEKLEAHVKALPGLDSYEIIQLERHYFMVEAAGKFCKEVPRCEHRLLELRDGVVKNVFAFEGTGKVWRLWSPLSFWVENLGDDYSAWAFETTENTYIRVDLPSFRNMVVISSPGSVEMKTLRACDGLKK